MRRAFIIILSKILYKIGKLIGKGSSLPGQIALKLDKNILTKLKLPETVIAVTGSNGKTSTTEMIYSILTENGYSVSCNVECANQTEGVTTMLLNNANIFGKVKKDIVLIETDERYARRTFKFFKPKYLVVTNLYRDQMTRNGHPELIYDIISDALDKNIHLVLNTDDPLSSLYGYKRKNVTYFGFNKLPIDKTENTSAYNDGKYCPNCKEELVYDYYHYNHIGSYSCKNCGHKRHKPKYAVTSLDLKKGTVKINKDYEMKVNLKSVYNVYNMLAAFAITNLVGVKEKKIIKSLSNYTLKNDRVQTFEINGHKGMLLTSKHENSISYNQSLQYINNVNEPCTVVVIIDAVSRKYFTSETSWVWDIDFDLRASDCVKIVILAGKYEHDLVTRFEFSKVNSKKVICKGDLDEMMKEVKENAEGRIFVVTCFSDRMKFMNRLDK